VGGRGFDDGGRSTSTLRIGTPSLACQDALSDTWALDGFRVGPTSVGPEIIPNGSIANLFVKMVPVGPTSVGPKNSEGFRVRRKSDWDPKIPDGFWSDFRRIDSTRARGRGFRPSIARTKQGWSQSSLAERCGLSPTQIAYFEQGRRRPTLDQFLLIAKGLDVSLQRLLIRSDRWSSDPSFPRRTTARWRNSSDST
jgi:DNA-binding XRE family transcriptional regulator